MSTSRRPDGDAKSFGVLAIVPAAGRAARFGGGKLIAPVAGEPLLDRTLASLLDAGVDHVVVVVAPDSDLSPVKRLADKRVQTIVNPDPARGMFSSIQTGMFLLHGDPMIVLPADMPFVSSATTTEIVAECRRRDAVVVPRHAGRRGHPLALPGRLRSAILDASSSATLSGLLTVLGIPRVEIDVSDPGVLRDVDVESDLN
jgi:molybdenum cofactor cytidylyltransferase